MKYKSVHLPILLSEIEKKAVTYIQYYIITSLFPILEMNWNVINIIKSESTLCVWNVLHTVQFCMEIIKDKYDQDA